MNLFCAPPEKLAPVPLERVLVVVDFYFDMCRWWWCLTGALSRPADDYGDDDDDGRPPARHNRQLALPFLLQNKKFVFSRKGGKS